jgi:hypothetical protein
MTHTLRVSSYAEFGGHRADSSSCPTESSSGGGIDRLGLVAHTIWVRWPDPAHWARRVLNPDSWHARNGECCPLFLEAPQPRHQHGSSIFWRSSHPWWWNSTTPITSGARGSPVKRDASHSPVMNLLTWCYTLMNLTQGEVRHAPSDGGARITARGPRHPIEWQLDHPLTPSSNGRPKPYESPLMSPRGGWICDSEI